MTETAEKLKQELAQLSPQDRAELAYFLIHSLDEEAEIGTEAAWDSELTHRMQSIDDGTARGESASQVLSDLREKYA
ncbi:MAG TPA: addiction module protein [Nodosilinea sp.]|nr:addiction module protein [Nodosilinea sp.]